MKVSQLSIQPFEIQEPVYVPSKEDQQLLREAETYLSLFHQEHGLAEGMRERLLSVRGMIEKAGTYWHT